MPEPDYWRDVLVSLRRIIRATDLQSRRVKKLFGVTIPQLMVLRSISELGDVTVKRVADDVSLSQATVTIILDRLEERELATRVRSTADKRIVNARLTPAGQALLASAPPLLHEQFTERFEALRPREQSRILEVLQQVATMMDAEAIDASPILDIDSPGR